MESFGDFEKNGYVVVKNAISKDVVDLITQYCLFDERENFLSEKDVGATQVPNAHFKYADLIMESLLIQVKPVVEKFSKKELYPTYSYYRVYRNGDDLKPHTDRPSCEISATVSFNYNYDEDPWPIFIDGKEIILYPGDIAIYKGIEKSHWRKELQIKDGEWHIQAFLHYVDKNGQHRSNRFDKRKDLGMKKNSEFKFDFKDPSEKFAGVVEVYDSIISNSEEIIKIANSMNQWIDAEIGNSESKKIDKKIRSNQTIFLSDGNGIFIHPEFDKVSTIVKLYIENYAKKYDVELEAIESPSILKYGIGQEYLPHSDSGKGMNRSVSAILYLNDVAEGGETEFVHFNKKVKPEKGRLIIFPSNYAYCHAALPPKIGEKYAMVFWSR